jgi:hypothetical protein
MLSSTHLHFIVRVVNIDTIVIVVVMLLILVRILIVVGDRFVRIVIDAEFFATTNRWLKFGFNLHKNH